VSGDTGNDFLDGGLGDDDCVGGGGAFDIRDSSRESYIGDMPRDPIFENDGLRVDLRARLGCL
jgi:hypothetical protein